MKEGVKTMCILVGAIELVQEGRALFGGFFLAITVVKLGRLWVAACPTVYTFRTFARGLGTISFAVTFDAAILEMGEKIRTGGIFSNFGLYRYLYKSWIF